MKRIIGLFFISSVFLTVSCSYDRFVLKEKTKSALPDKTQPMAVLCYSTDDVMSEGLSFCLSKAMISGGYNVMPYEKFKEALPSYPEDFFLDQPVFEKRNSKDVMIPQANVTVLINAAKRLKVKYLLFVEYDWEYTTDMKWYLPRGIKYLYTNTFLLDVDKAQGVAFLARESSESEWGVSLNPKRKDVVEKIMKYLPKASEDFAKYYTEKMTL